MVAFWMTKHIACYMIEKGFNSWLIAIGMPEDSKLDYMTFTSKELSFISQSTLDSYYWTCYSAYGRYQDLRDKTQIKLNNLLKEDVIE